MMTQAQERNRRPATQGIRRLCNEIADWKVAAIMQLGADITALEEAAARASGADDAMPVEDRSPGDPAARIHEILMAGGAAHGRR